MDFIPMLWGGNTSIGDMVSVENFILAHPEIQYLLVMNEPNLKDQANRTPVEAATDWIKYEQVITRHCPYDLLLTTTASSFNDSTSISWFVQQILDAQNLPEAVRQRRKLDLLPRNRVFLRPGADPLRCSLTFRMMLAANPII